MAIDLSSISAAKTQRAPRIVLLGVEKIGKSTFAAGADRPVFLPIKGEEGIDDLDVPRFPSLNSYGDVLDAIGALYQDQHNYGTVVIDSASALEPLVWAEVCRLDNAPSIEKVGGGYGKGYIEAALLWQELTAGLDALRADRNMACILIGHVKVRSFNNPLGENYDHYLFDLHEKAMNQLYRWADSILFMNSKVAVKKEAEGFGSEKKRAVDIAAGQRFLFTQKRAAHPGGGRGVFGRIPYEIPIPDGDGWGALVRELQKVSGDEKF